MSPVEHHNYSTNKQSQVEAGLMMKLIDGEAGEAWLG